MSCYTDEKYLFPTPREAHERGADYFRRGRPCVVLREGDFYAVKFYRVAV